jgi:exosortase/archaeosortase family protein
VIVIGVMGTLLVNIVRVTLVCLIAAWWGYVPAVLFHDYGGTLMIIGWLFAFWIFSYQWIVVSDHDLETLNVA